MLNYTSSDFFTGQYFALSLRSQIKDCEVAKKAVQDYHDIFAKYSSAALYTFLLELAAFPSLDTIARVVAALPKDMKRSTAQNHLAAIRVAIGRGKKGNKWLKDVRDRLDKIDKSADEAQKAEGRKILDALKKADFSFEESGKKLALVAPDLGMLAPVAERLVDQEARETEEGEEAEEAADVEEEAAEEEDGRKILTGQRTFGQIIVGDVFSGAVAEAIVDVLNDTNYREYVESATATVRHIFLGADLPTFLTKNAWDSVAFVGCTAPDVLAKMFAKMVAGIFGKDKSGMAVIFCDLASQMMPLKSHFEKLKECGKVRITGLRELVVYRARYKASDFSDPNRHTLSNNCVFALQVTLYF